MGVFFVVVVVVACTNLSIIEHSLPSPGWKNSKDKFHLLNANENTWLHPWFQIVFIDSKCIKSLPCAGNWAKGGDVKNKTCRYSPKEREWGRQTTHTPWK